MAVVGGSLGLRGWRVRWLVAWLVQFRTAVVTKKTTEIRDAAGL